MTVEYKVTRGRADDVVAASGLQQGPLVQARNEAQSQGLKRSTECVYDQLIQRVRLAEDVFIIEVLVVDIQCTGIVGSGNSSGRRHSKLLAMWLHVCVQRAVAFGGQSRDERDALELLRSVVVHADIVSSVGDQEVSDMGRHGIGLYLFLLLLISLFEGDMEAMCEQAFDGGWRAASRGGRKHLPFSSSNVRMRAPGGWYTTIRRSANAITSSSIVGGAGSTM